MSHKIFRIFLILAALCVAMVSVAEPAAKKTRKRTPQTNERSMKAVKREQAEAQKAIQKKSRQLDANKAKTNEELANLSALQGELERKTQEITSLKNDLSIIDLKVRIASDSMALLQKNLLGVKNEYARALRKMQGTYRSANILSYLFSSKNFSEAMARYRYLREFSRWRDRKLQEISAATVLVDSQRRQLGSLHQERSIALTSLSGAESELRKKRDESDRLVAKLKKEGKSLQADIANQQRRLNKLGNELDRLIAAEQRRQEEARKREQARRAAEEKAARAKAAKNKKNSKKSSAAETKPKPAPSREVAGTAADRALSGSFESNRGRLLFPVRGNYRIVRGFGRQRHPELGNVVTDNSGIDIAVGSGGHARSIFEGVVSGIFTADGYNKVVMIRHGNYISIYAGLSSVSVRSGQKVSANTDLGVIAPDPQYDNRPVLHFELRKERVKLNPSQWVR